MPYIERIQVETEGFLSGLDLKLRPGLNVLIGARGTGKTSILELVRYCLDAGAFTDDAETRGREQAIAILEGGAITVTVRDHEVQHVVTRSASGHLSSTTSQMPSCTVLAQNEIEVVGKQASSRMQLIDMFRPNKTGTSRKLASVVASLRSLTVEMSTLIRETANIAERLSIMGPLEQQLAEAREAQNLALARSTTSEAQRDRLSLLQAASQTVATRTVIITDAKNRIARLSATIAESIDLAGLSLPVWPSSAGDDELAGAREALEQAREGLHVALANSEMAGAEVQNSLEKVDGQSSLVDEQLREIRQTLESLEVGIGAAARAVTELEQRQGEVEALKSQLDEVHQQYRNLEGKREGLFAEHEALRNQIYDDRELVVSDLNEVLSPAIKVRLKRSVEVDDYKSAIIATLRGTGVHYNPIAPVIAENVAPFELVRWVDKSDSLALSAATGLSLERSAALVRALQETGTGDISAAIIDDGVELDLRDGADFKPSDRLSIGQRCTVVLPILLAKHGEPLLIDQPEDHLDNAFVASTLVEALRRRLPHDQFLFTTHNANIPVLGDADWVMVMGSDGRRGFLSHAGSLDEPATVDAITNLLEGGKDAFKARAAFYS